MTDGGLAALRALADGTPRTIAEVASLTRICQRKTRGALAGSLVAGLVEEEITDARRYRITESGLEALAEWPA